MVLDATWLINIATWLQPVITLLKVMSLNGLSLVFLIFLFLFFVKLMIRSTVKGLVLTELLSFLLHLLYIILCMETVFN